MAGTKRITKVSQRPFLPRPHCLYRRPIQPPPFPSLIRAKFPCFRRYTYHRLSISILIISLRYRVNVEAMDIDFSKSLSEFLFKYALSFDILTISSMPIDIHGRDTFCYRRVTHDAITSRILSKNKRNKEDISRSMNTFSVYSCREVVIRRRQASLSIFFFLLLLFLTPPLKNQTCCKRKRSRETYENGNNHGESYNRERGLIC